jgi:hypothetical protein
MKLKLRVPVKYWPRSISPRSRVAPAGTIVDVERQESATAYVVKVPDTNDVLLVLASEVEAADPQAA